MIFESGRWRPHYGQPDRLRRVLSGGTISAKIVPPIGAPPFCMYIYIILYSFLIYIHNLFFSLMSEMPFSSDDARSLHYYSSFRFSIPLEETLQADLIHSNIGDQRKNPNNNIAQYQEEASSSTRCFKDLRKMCASIKQRLEKIFCFSRQLPSSSTAK